MTTVEFYLGKKGKMIASVKSYAVPRKGESISIRQVTYIIQRVTWAVDYADSISDKRLRACVELKQEARK